MKKLLLILFGLFFLFPLISSANWYDYPSLETDLLTYYNFSDTGFPIVDNTGNGWDLEVFDFGPPYPTFSSTGISGDSVYMFHQGFAASGAYNTTNLNFPLITFCSWLNTSMLEVQGDGFILSDLGRSYGNIKFQLLNASGPLEVRLNIPDDSDYLPTVPYLINPDQWYHYCMTDDGTNYTLYVNGAFVETKNKVTNTSSGGIGFYIGYLTHSYNDEAGIWTRVLNSTEIDWVYQIGLSGNTRQGPNTDFVSTWDTTQTGVSTSSQIRLPLYNGGTYNFLVEWGDGTNDTITAYNQAAVTHTYPSPGTYTVNISGTIIGWRFNNGGDRRKLIEISQWGDLRLGNLASNFYGTSNLNITATDTLNLSGTTNLQNSFRASKITDIPNVNTWDVSKVTNMQFLFYSTPFNGNISNWDVSKVTRFDRIFQNNQQFNGDVSNWNLSSTTHLTTMFANTTFNGNISNWDVSNVESFGEMFYLNYAFNQSLNNWDVSGGTVFGSMFRLSSYNLPLNNWNLSSAFTLDGMFYDNPSFNQDISNWDVSTVQYFDNMFIRAYSFNQDIGNWNTSGASGMIAMFAYATSFNQNISGWDVSNVLDMNSMFQGATSFNQDIGNWDVSSVNTNMNNMFNGATSFDQDLGNWDVSLVHDATDMFLGVNLSTPNYDSLLIGWASLPSLQFNVPFNAGGSQYSSAAQSARDVLTGTYGWIITDGGPVPVPSDPVNEICASGELTMGDAAALAGIILTIILVGTVLATLVLTFTGFIDISKIGSELTLEKLPGAIVIIGLTFLILSTMALVLGPTVCGAFGG